LSTDKKHIDHMQIKLIHIAKAKLGLSEEDYRGILSERYWVNTCKDLGYDEATELIKYFQTQGFRIITKRYAHSAKRKALNVIDLVSPQQLAKIEHLKADIRWRVHDGFFRWLRKFLKFTPTHPSPLEGEGKGEGGVSQIIQTSKKANAVIEALKAMRLRQEKSARMDNEAGNALRRDGGMHGGHYQW
jgi:hypothetical protein